jgi:MerR family transcriptional regulator, thiopeptide resistance regulator
MMIYTVKQLSSLAGVSVRTLHYYDEIDLLKPSSVGENGYRYYEDEAVFRLQQILFFREMELSLKEIRDIIALPAFDVLAALQMHHDRLRTKARRLKTLINTVDNTILHLTGEVEMSKKQLFDGFSKDDEKRYEQEAREKWGNDEVGASSKLWNSYSAQKQQLIKDEGGAIYADMVKQIEAGNTPDSPESQAIVARWHQHLRYFYEPSIDRLRGLGQMYVDSPDFAKKFDQMHPDLATFMREAISVYCDDLEENG